MSGGYRWRKIPDWAPGDPRYRRTAPEEAAAGSAGRTARRERRIDAFAAALAILGKTDPQHVTRAVAIEAGRTIGVKEKTAAGYLTALRQRQPAGGEPR